MAAVTLAVIWAVGQPHATWLGVGVAAVCGAVTSGIGYALWYVVLEDLRTGFAAIVQLTVPVLNSAADVILLGEELTWRGVLACAAILGGDALALRGKPTAEAVGGSV
jgi:drug/metabolite transporter (DMT)-like permease